ncbi:MAG: polysaccharide biosynthesis protein [Actinomycetia bacterium]|nr:polysaccharide biosynthesis protein [Actinomycetes bacterium]
MIKRFHLFQIIFDAILLILALFIANEIRFDFNIPPSFFSIFKETIAIFVIIKIPIFYILGMYGRMWRYTSRKELSNIITSSTTSTLLIVFIIFFLLKIPYSRAVIILDLLLTIFFLGGVRFVTRSIYEYRTKKTISPYKLKPLLIIGAGDGGEGILREIFKFRETNYNPCGFLDDDIKKHGLKIHGIPVLGKINDLLTHVQRYEIEEIIIAIPSVSRGRIKEIVLLCEEAGIRPKILPGIYELVSGDITLSMIRDVEIKDVLGREPVRVDLEIISNYIKGKCILVTGAGGSIGSELCFQLSNLKPKRIILLERTEENLFHLEMELYKKGFKDFKSYLCDIYDDKKVKEIFDTEKPSIVFHSAAYKHVPLIEKNQEEAIKNNLIGTKKLLDVIDKSDVEKFILISTDKAVNPKNIMGASKFLAERLVLTYKNKTKTNLAIVRFGNVLGSSGSVIPIFKEQIKRGGPITVTDFRMTRYFMTITEAVQLVIQAGALDEEGDIFILDMGEPIKIIELANNMIKLSGFKPDVDIKIEEIGKRLGEKLEEELHSKEEELSPTSHKKIFVIKSVKFNKERFLENIYEIETLLQERNNEVMFSRIFELIPTLNSE